VSQPTAANANPAAPAIVARTDTRTTIAAVSPSQPTAPVAVPFRDVAAASPAVSDTSGRERFLRP
jgi:hypothetical protein